MKSLEVVVGAQFGSEAKGHVVQRLAERALREGDPLQVVRVAGPNAGHTGYDRDGQPWALRQVPVAAVVEGPMILGIAAGSEIDLPVLLDEYDQLHRAGRMIDKFMWVSGEATMITDHDKAVEAGLAGHANLPKAIGSTGKGIGAARAARIMREPGRRLADDDEAVQALADRGIAIADSRHRVRHTGAHVHHLIIEGTQGYGLGLHAGYYPQCTSSNCRAIDFMAMAGVSPFDYRQTTVWAVARMYPIRVAGNSGPLKDETTWEALGLPEERTTVTKKVRRVGMPDWELVRQAVLANGGGDHVKLAVTMVDQMFPFMRDRGYYDAWTDAEGEQNEHELRSYLDRIQRGTGASIGLITTGPNKGSFL